MNVVWHCEIDILIIKKLIMCNCGTEINNSIKLITSINRLIFQKIDIVLIRILRLIFCRCVQSTVLTLVINIFTRLINQSRLIYQSSVTWTILTKQN